MVNHVLSDSTEFRVLYVCRRAMMCVDYVQRDSVTQKWSLDWHVRSRYVPALMMTNFLPWPVRRTSMETEWRAAAEDIFIDWLRVAELAIRTLSIVVYSDETIDDRTTVITRRLDAQTSREPASTSGATWLNAC